MSLDMSELRYGSELVKRGFARMQKGGVVMDVTNAEEAKIAEEAGAVAVMALERVPADIREVGGVARMADPQKVKEIIESVDIPVMAKCRIGHFVEAQILESLEVDMIDESEVLTPADPFYHVDKEKFDIPFVCGCRNLGEALRRLEEGAAMMRTKGEAGTGNIIEAVRHQKEVMGEIRELKEKNKEELKDVAKEHGVSLELVQEVAEMQRLPVVNFAAGGIATPADAALMMQLGSDGVFVGSGIFKSENPERMGKAIVDAVTYYDDPKKLAEISEGLGEAMSGKDIETIPKEERLQDRESSR
ncbi:MAG: pyridoxal 5'-phosphate synthase lyase subunit PdxS [Candidatus Saliniplasma sp.]